MNFNTLTPKKNRISKGLIEPVLFFKDIKSKIGKNLDLTKCSSGKIWTIIINKNYHINTKAKKTRSNHQ